MKDTADWDALRLFLAVARAGGLGPAARAIGVSAPTLGRRMVALERRLNRRLFERRQTGYELTADGRALHEQVREMEAVAAGIDSRRTPRRVVRISAGAWTSRFLAGHVDRLWQPGDPATIAFLTGAGRLDIVRREADIGLRNRSPEEARLSGRRVNDIAFAIYRSRAAPPVDPARAAWIGAAGEAGVTPSARWVAARHVDRVAMSCTDPRLVLDLLAAGAGIAVLPCFVGDAEPTLTRVGGIIADLQERQWLVLNDSERHQPAVRLVIDRIVGLMAENRDLMRGARPSP